MGKLYNLLSICAWRQDHLDKAEGYARRALEIGEKIDSKIVTTGAKSNLATVFSFRGQLKESLTLYQGCIEKSRFLDDDRARGAALSNLGAVYHQMGNFSQAIKTQKQAIQVYESLNLPTNISIAYCGLGLVETEIGDLDTAEKSLSESLRYAERANYIRGKHACAVYLADVYARRGDFARANELLNNGIKGFQELRLNEALNFEIVGRVNRLQGKVAAAKAALQSGLVHAEQFPLERAAIVIELAIIESEEGRREDVQRLREQAAKIYEECGASLRAEVLKKS